MTKLRPKRIRVAPKFYERLKVKQIEEGFPNLIDYTDHLSDETKDLDELFKKRKFKKNEKMRFNF